MGVTFHVLMTIVCAVLLGHACARKDLLQAAVFIMLTLSNMAAALDQYDHSKTPLCQTQQEKPL